MSPLSNWREESDLFEVVTGKMTDTQALKKVSEKKGIKNKVIINPKLSEAVKELGGELIEASEEEQDTQQDEKDKAAQKQIDAKQRRGQMIKKQVLLKKLMAVRAGSQDIVASYEPDIEGVVEYFYEEGINEEGFDQILEEIGLEDFVDFVEGGAVELNEERDARRASVRAKKYPQVKAEVDKSDAAKKAAKKGEYAPSYAKKETDVTVYDDKPAAKKPVAKKVKPTPVAKKPVAKKVEKAVAKVKPAQPKKPASKEGLRDRIKSAYKAGVKRHRKATQPVRVFHKGMKAGAKKAVKFAKDVKKVVSEKLDYDPMDDPDFDHDEAMKNRGVSGKNNPKGGMKLKDILKNGKKSVKEEVGISSSAKMAKARKEAELRRKEELAKKKKGKSDQHKAAVRKKSLNVNKQLSSSELRKYDTDGDGKVRVVNASYNPLEEDYETQKKKEVLRALKKRDLEKSAKEKIAADIVRRKGDTSKSDDRYAYEEVVLEKDLSAAERRALPDKDFALPGKGKGPQGKQAGSYPIPDEKHARSALSLVSQHGTPEEKAEVRAKVKKKFPNIDVSEAKVDTGSAEEKASARNLRNTPPGGNRKFDTSVFITRKPGESLDSARTRKRREAHAKKRGMKEDRALDIVRANIIKKHGERSIHDPERDKPTEAQKKAAAAERQKRQAEKNKAFADRAKKAGYKSTQDYANVVARYGSEDNMKKGTGLGS